MNTHIRTATIALGLGAACPAHALPPLHEDPVVLNGFYAIGMADELRKNCPTIEPRILRALSYVQTLESYAREKGYSTEEIKALKDNKAEKEKLRRRIESDLAARGAVPGNVEAYCDVGQQEIAKDSAVGRLLREK